MSPLKRIIILVNLAVILAYTAYYVTGKERTLEDGQLVLLELVPRDPRSLMQGDYMTLVYAIGQGLERDSLPVRGYVILELDEDGVGSRKRIQEEREPLGAGEQAISFRRRSAGAMRVGPILVGSDSYFFEEGRADDFANARYGGLRVDDRGGSVLVGLWDEEFRRIE